MHYLLASHGSPGAIAAEQVALHQCREGDYIDHLLIVPDWWADMTGDDWLNSGASRNRYRAYIEEQLNQDAEEVFLRVENGCKTRGIHYSSIFVVGNCLQVFKQFICTQRYAKIFTGSRRPSSCAGVNDRMLTKKIIKRAGCKLVMVEHPNASCVT